MKKTKIVCTIGPKTESKEVLKQLLEAGMNVMRLNFSHGDYEEHGRRISNLREVMAETGMRAAILLDTKGPEIRTIKLEGGNDVSLVAGQEFTFTTDRTVIGNNKIVAVTYEGFASDLKAGDTVLVDDGLIAMEVKEVAGNEVRCIVKNNGDLGENKGINLPNVSVNLPALAEKDINDLKFGCEQGIDFVAASFIRKAEDVLAVRKVLCENGGENVKIISKIENQEGLNNFDEILEVTDGVMVARGDLGVEIPVEEVPFAQKMMIEKCNEAGKPVITATQMLDSMIKNPRPTRAEANDVANAIIDGTDAVMLSGETAKGKYPVEAVKVMARIAEKTDPLIYTNVEFDNEESTITEAVAKGTVDVAEALEAKLIVVGTGTGRAAKSLRKYFPTARILALTNSQTTANQLLLSRGVLSVVAEKPETLDCFFKQAEAEAVKTGLVKSGDIIVVTCGEQVYVQGTTNTMKVIKVK
ncbi:MAG: pyruvate kinase PykF [Fusobacterium sp.]|uniref:pyruvate kinase PykF n=1 Tax=unclassified Fusobacterium TaxID=2648384 RepID=UPI001DA99A53|nr:pyruvate kinase PykF [Fusobacterium sp.]